jgi:alkylated DNA repair protein alkB family protein 8
MNTPFSQTLHTHPKMAVEQAGTGCKPTQDTVKHFKPLPGADPAIQRYPNGLVLVRDFISPEEESILIDSFNADPAVAIKLAAQKSKIRKKAGRIIQHVGYHFDYTTFGASATHFTPVPPQIASLLPRLPLTVDGQRAPDQFTTQYYPPGAGIPPHVDTHSLFDEALYSLSFGAAVPMQFRRTNASDARRMRVPKRSLSSGLDTPSKAPAPSSEAAAADDEADDDQDSWELLLPPRSLLVMTGASRYGYVHAIRARKTDVVDGQTVPREGRYSLTMRTIRRGDEIACHCAFPAVCDARIREEMEGADECEAGW